MCNKITCINQSICRVMHEFLDKIVSFENGGIFFDWAFNSKCLCIGIVAFVGLHIHSSALMDPLSQGQLSKYARPTLGALQRRTFVACYSNDYVKLTSTNVKINTTIRRWVWNCPHLNLFNSSVVIGDNVDGGLILLCQIKYKLGTWVYPHVFIFSRDTLDHGMFLKAHLNMKNTTFYDIGKVMRSINHCSLEQPWPFLFLFMNELPIIIFDRRWSYLWMNSIIVMIKLTSCSG